MTPYKDFDFAAARAAAFEAVSRCYSVRGSASDNDWYVQLEINAPDTAESVEVTLRLTPEFPMEIPYIYLPIDDIARLDFPPNINTPAGEICTFDRNSVVPSPSQPEYLVLDCLHRAREILEEGYIAHHASDFEDEYMAYWECTFPGEPEVDLHVLSLHPDTESPEDPPTFVLLDRLVGGFGSVLYTDQAQFRAFKEFLDRIHVQYLELPTFFLSDLPDLVPPFAIDGAKEEQLLRDLGRLADFNKYARQQRRRLVLTFSRTIQDRHLLFGWKHEPRSRTTGHSAKKHRGVSAPRAKATHFVTRFSPDILSSTRLQERTSGDFPEPRPLAGPSVLVAGLGSVGSNLLPLLETVNFTEYRLLDPDVLEINNIRRHILGLQEVGQLKVEGAHDYLQNRNPLLHIETCSRRLLDVIRLEPDFLAAASYHFFCTGDTNSEMYLGSNLHKSRWGRPSFFIWVEPYLAGGHCIFYDPSTRVDWESLFPDNQYTLNVISPAEYERRSFTRRELGCQISFTPFGASSVKLFLFALFPTILEILQTGGGSRAITWVGNKEALRTLGIEVANRYDTTPSFSLIQSEL